MFTMWYTSHVDKYDTNGDTKYLEFSLCFITYTYKYICSKICFTSSYSETHNFLIFSSVDFVGCAVVGTISGYIWLSGHFLFHSFGEAWRPKKAILTLLFFCWFTPFGMNCYIFNKSNFYRCSHTKYVYFLHRIHGKGECVVIFFIFLKPFC